MQNKKNEILLFFGSFNPIHIGHLAIGNYISENYDFKEFWFVLTPHNPLKTKENLLDDRQRKYMLELAINNYPKFKISDIEFYLPKPNYTINTLTYLSEKFPNKKFSLLIGGDNLENFHKWKNYKIILRDYKLYVYKRPNTKILEKYNEFKQEIPTTEIEILESPQFEISSNFIRTSIKQGKDIRFFLPDKVWNYINKMNFYM